MTTPARLAVLGTALLAIGCARGAAQTIDIATTTSVQNSGLLGHLLPIFEQASGITVRVHAAGSGRALQMLTDGVVDAVISHAPDTEQRLLPQHPDWRYRKVAHNWFVLAGPEADPARVSEAADAVAAFQRIADSGEKFVSRGDESGTHERERILWTAAGRHRAQIRTSAPRDRCRVRRPTPDPARGSSRSRAGRRRRSAAPWAG